MRLSFLRTAAVGCVYALTALAQVSVTVPKLVEFVKSSVSQKLPDKDVALEVAKLRLTQKLEDQTIEDLQTAGAGPRTVAALTKLADESAKLPPPPPPPPPQAVPTGGPPPSNEEQKRIIEAVREYALNYSKSLPDFLCLQVTNRSVNHNYKPGDQAWTPQDRLIEKLSYVDHQEKYELQSRNDNAMIGKTWETVGGSLSRGEWASLLQAVFDPGTDTYFSWTRWANLRGKRYHVYRYQVDQAHSRETLDAEGKKVTPAFHGDIYVPFDSNVVWWISVEPEPPADFPMQDVKEVLKYNYVEISGQQFLLPLTSEVVMREGRIGNRNEIEFRRYQKYSADAVIKFDDIDVPGSDDKAADKPGDNKKKPPKP
jgi:hypothetical protein